MTRLGTAALLLAMAIAAGCAATADDRAGSSDDDVHLGTPPDAGVDATVSADAEIPSDAGAATDAAPPPRGPSTTAMTAKLAAIGLDVNNLPPLHDLPTSQKLKVMKTFNESMGVTCNTCHDVSDYAAPTHKKEVALFAWESISRTLTMNDGGALYCDSCHYGKFDFLDKSNHQQLEGWMKTNFVDQIKTKNGTATTCSTCHGDEPVQTDAGL